MTTTDQTTRTSLRLVFLLRRRADITTAEFQHYWLNCHAPLVAELAGALGIGGYRQMHTLTNAPAVGDPFDGVAEIFVDGVEPSHDERLRRKAAQTLLEDERKFIHLERSPLWFAREEPITSGSEAGTRVNTVLQSPQIDTEAIRTRLKHLPLQRHRSMLLHTPRNARSELAAARSSPAPFDLMIETWTGQSFADPGFLVSAMSEHVAGAGMSPDQYLIWCSQRHEIVGRR